MDDNKINLEIEKIANLMVHDDVSSDEQDVTKLEKYRDQIKSDLNIDDEEAMKLVYETLVYRKLKSSDSSDMLEKGTDFGAGFSWSYSNGIDSTSSFETPFHNPIIPSGSTSSTLVICWILIWFGAGPGGHNWTI